MIWRRRIYEDNGIEHCAEKLVNRGDSCSLIPIDSALLCADGRFRRQREQTHLYRKGEKNAVGPRAIRLGRCKEKQFSLFLFGTFTVTLTWKNAHCFSLRLHYISKH